MSNNWFLYCKKADFAAISEKFHISPMLARILVNRGIESDDDISDFLFAGKEKLHDPFLFAGMKEGISLTLDMIRQGKKIRIIGDYDVDGVCAAYILKRTLTLLDADADVRLPDRILDGYGMNESMAEDAERDGVSLIITCDNGVSSFDAVSLAREKGIHVIITDHHEVPGTLPPADVIIDAKCPGNTYPFRELCGAGVAYKFSEALLKSAGCDSDQSEKFLDDMMQYAGMATIADIVSLKGENHIFSKLGIDALKRTESPGLLALMDVKGILPHEIHGFHIGFVLGPSINSAGRLKNAKIAFDLLDSEDHLSAQKIASELNDLNEERKALTMDQTRAAEEILSNDPDIASGHKKVIVLYLPKAHESVAGIIAGKIKEEYGRPALVITDSEDGLKGSARSTDDFNIIEALNRHPEAFKKAGGHAKAAGFTLNCRPEELEQMLNEDPESKNISDNHKVWIDMQLPFRYVTENLIHELEMLEPFGMENERPKFAERNITFRSVRLIGRNQNVIKLDMEGENGDRLDGVMFSHGRDIMGTYNMIIDEINEKGSQARFSIMYYPGLNEFRGMRYLQAVIEEIRVS